MTNLTSAEKIALEEVFIILDDRKNNRMRFIKKYFMFYKCMRIFSNKKILCASST